MGFDRGEVDDRTTPPLGHPRQQRVGQAQNMPEIDVVQFLPQRRRVGGEGVRRLQVVADIVDEYIGPVLDEFGRARHAGPPAAHPE
jgi:hypothetical protein